MTWLPILLLLTLRISSWVRLQAHSITRTLKWMWVVRVFVMTRKKFLENDRIAFKMQICPSLSPHMVNICDTTFSNAVEMGGNLSRDQDETNRFRVRPFSRSQWTSKRWMRDWKRRARCKMKYNKKFSSHAKNLLQRTRTLEQYWTWLPFIGLSVSVFGAHGYEAVYVRYPILCFCSDPMWIFCR